MSLRRRRGQLSPLERILVGYLAVMPSTGLTEETTTRGTAVTVDTLGHPVAAANADMPSDAVALSQGEDTYIVGCAIQVLAEVGDIVEELMGATVSNQVIEGYGGSLLRPCQARSTPTLGLRYSVPDFATYSLCQFRRTYFV